MRQETSVDNYLRKVADIKPIPGIPIFDSAMRLGGPSLIRIFETVRGGKQQEFPKDSGEILCKGAACGFDEAGTCRHFTPGMKFIGFLEGQSEARAVVKTRGAIILKIEGATNESRGLPVFTTGPNSFSLRKANGAAEIGAIRFFQDSRVSVAFKRDGDETPLDLEV